MVMSNMRPAQKVVTHHAGFIFETPIRTNISYVPFDRKIHFIAFVSDKASLNDHWASICYIIFSVGPGHLFTWVTKTGKCSCLFSMKKYRVEMVTVGVYCAVVKGSTQPLRLVV